MFKSRLENFLAKRILVLWAIVSAAGFLALGIGRATLFGIAAGAALSLLTVRANAWLLGRLVRKYAAHGGKKAVTAGIIAFTVKELLIFQLFVIVYVLSSSFFWGLTAGALLAPFAVLINFATESLGYTNNHFYV